MKYNIVSAAIKSLSKKELALWLVSMSMIVCSFLISPKKDIFTLISSLLGICGVFFVGKGMILGQYFFVIFALFYGFVSIKFRYYSEVITYLGMNAPISILAIISWMKHPFEDSAVVEVAHMKPSQFIQMGALTACVTTAFYFILKFLGTTNLPLSTVSVGTSFVASYFEVMRSSYYAAAFMVNDIILISMWTYATFHETAYFPMIICFVFFFINDLYGFYNWQKMKFLQKKPQGKA